MVQILVLFSNRIGFFFAWDSLLVVFNCVLLCLSPSKVEKFLLELKLFNALDFFSGAAAFLFAGTPWSFILLGNSA